jgi:hypothetical protein
VGKGDDEGGRGNESYDRKKAWSSIDNSILSGASEHVLQRVERLRKRDTLEPLSLSQQVGEGRERTKNKTTARQLWASSYIFLLTSETILCNSLVSRYRIKETPRRRIMVTSSLHEIPRIS